MVPVMALVTRRSRELGDVVTLELEAPGWKGFDLGQFNMLSVFGIGEVAISISGRPGDNSRITHTIRDVGAVSHALCDLDVGAAIGLRGPYGAAWPIDKARGRDVLVIAGGLGLAPVRPVLYELLENRDAYGKVTLLYGARGPDDILYGRELAEWRARLDFGVEVTVDRAGSAWHGHVGVVTGLIRGADFAPQNTTAFVCGPEIMMRYAALGLEQAGLSGRDIWLSMERNMQCGVGLCGHCQMGRFFICKDGPVFDWETIGPLMAIKEV